MGDQRPGRFRLRGCLTKSFFLRLELPLCSGLAFNKRAGFGAVVNGSEGEFNREATYIAPRSRFRACLSVDSPRGIQIQTRLFGSRSSLAKRLLLGRVNLAERL
jgi:hypothetical protein